MPSDSATPQPPPPITGNRPDHGAPVKTTRPELSPSQRTVLAQKVAELLRLALRIERERRG